MTSGLRLLDYKDETDCPLLCPECSEKDEEDFIDD